MSSFSYQSRSETAGSSKPFLQALAGKINQTPPIWLMRQAGRYLPEYMKLRDQAGSFLKLCYTPALATEVTLQPIRRFGFDAAILFSDILVVPDALGQKVWFEDGEGPRLEPIADALALTRLDPGKAGEVFEIVYEAVERIRGALPDEVALIGFCGAPWTVATYMVAGRGTPDQMPARLWAYGDPDGFQQLIDLLVDVSVDYLSGQISAGAEAVQIFDSWAGCLPDQAFERWALAPMRELVSRLRARHADVPIIGFPRAAGPLYRDYVEQTSVTAVSCDTSLPLSWIRDNLQPLATVQGNLDPIALLAGGEALERRVEEIIRTLAGGPHIFNLGHGILKQTPPDHVAQLVKLVRSIET